MQPQPIAATKAIHGEVSLPLFSDAYSIPTNKYLFTATIRRDGSSKFGKNNRYGYFPSFSLGWNVAEEKFMENVHWLDQLKLRGGSVSYTHLRAHET